MQRNNLNFCTRAAARVQKFFHHYIWNPACNNLFITKFEMRFTALPIIGNEILILLLLKIIHGYLGLLDQKYSIFWKKIIKIKEFLWLHSKLNYRYFIVCFNENGKPNYCFVFSQNKNVKNPWNESEECSNWVYCFHWSKLCSNSNWVYCFVFLKSCIFVNVNQISVYFFM